MSDVGTETDDLPLPLGNTFDQWKLMVRGLKQLNADKNPVSGEQLSKLVKIPETVLSGNIKFLRRLNIITQDSKSSQITLSENGIKYTESLILKDSQKEKEILSILIKTKLNEIIGFCDLHKQSDDLTFDMVFDQIKLLSNTPDVQGQTRNVYSQYRTAIYTIIEMLVYAGVLDDSYLSSNNKPQAPKDKTKTTRVIREKFPLPTTCELSWLKKLFQAIRDHNPQKLDRTFITASVDKNNHQGSILTTARFLGITDKDGNILENFNKLRFYGDEDFKKNLREIIKDKYSDVLNNLDIEKIEKANLVSVIMDKYKVGDIIAQRAVEVMVNLCTLGEMNLSDSLKSRTEKPVDRTKPKAEITERKEQKIQEHKNIVSTIPIIHEKSERGLDIEVKIHIDAKDQESFSNTLKFIKELNNLTDVTSEIEIQKE